MKIMFRFVCLLVGSSMWSPAHAAVMYNTVFETGFEATETPSYAVPTQIHNVGSPTQPWNWAGPDIGVVSSAPAAVKDGAQGLSSIRSSSPNSRYLWTRGANAFDPLTGYSAKVSLAVKTVGWGATASSLLEIWAQGADVTANDSPENKANRSAWITLLGNGELRAYTASSTLTLATGISITSWNLISMEIDLSAKKYEVSLNNIVIASDVAFYGNGAKVNSLSSIQFKDYNAGASTGGYYLDNITLDAEVIPEPATLSLIALAIAGMTLCRRRIRTAHA